MDTCVMSVSQIAWCYSMSLSSFREVSSETKNKIKIFQKIIVKIVYIPIMDMRGFRI